MRHTFTILAAAALLIAACSAPAKEESPIQSAVRTKIVSTVGDGASVDFSAFAVTDSTTYGKELEYRRKLIQIKLEQDTKYYNDYKARKMPTNAEKHKAAMEKDRTVLAGLEKVEAALADSLNVIAYYDCTFSGKAKLNGSTTVFDGYCASVTPYGNVLAMQSGAKGLHTGLGRILPGYAELFDE